MVTSEVETAVSPRSWPRRVGTWAVFVGLTAVMTWPMALVFATRTVDHFDIFFNIWRLRWIHHALTTAPAHLFDGNQFFPEHGVLGYSDAVLVQGVLAAPLFSLGLPTVLVHNLLLLGGMCASGIGMCALARHLTRHEGAAILAGVVFAFAPYRFGHIMHLEMQWAVWSPWAFWALQRALDSGKLKFGALVGVFAALQMMSSVYYALFLGIILAVVGGMQWLFTPREIRLRAMGALAAGALIVGACAAVYARPYQAAAARVGARSIDEVRQWSAGLGSYRSVSETNWLYRRFPKGWDENSLFPGFVPPILGLIGLVAVRPRRTALIYALGMFLALDLSLGTNGIVYPWLYKYGGVFGGLRAPARASIFFLLCLGVLAARGCKAVVDRTAPRFRVVATAALIGLVTLEYWVPPLRMVAYPNQPPPLDQFLQHQPYGVVAHFPMAQRFRLPGFEPQYVFGSTFHWKPLVNGYSGYYPPSYLTRLVAVENFPDARSIEFLRGEGVKYLVLHEALYRGAAPLLIMALQTLNLVPVARLNDGYGSATVYELQ
jgi:hypothetical protein